ncbi:MAG: hypothetical protein FWG63_00480 [Defluviitaleaceae bacterium]|nr:hypothetical protein [Defluviitaleaceae bacterium]
MPKCKYAKKMKSQVGGQTLEHCYCTSKNTQLRSKYSGISKRNDVYVQGSSNYPKEDGNYWTMCIGGKFWENGITPSKCGYYS